MINYLKAKITKRQTSSLMIFLIMLLLILLITQSGYSQQPPDSSDSTLVSSIRSNSLSAAFFAAVPFLWTGKDSDGNLYPGDAVLKKPDEAISYHPFDQITITLLKNASYKAGDTIDIFSSLRIVRFQNASANLVKRVGRGVVLTVDSKKMTARLITVWDVIEGGERISHYQQFPNLSFNTLINADISLKAQILTRAENTESPCIFQTLILDKGSDDGVKTGDIFTIFHHFNKDSLNFSSFGLTANVSSKSASVVLIKISDNHISDKDIAVLFKRVH